MRVLSISPETFPIFYTALMQGGITTKEAKVAKRTVRKFKSVAVEEQDSQVGYKVNEVKTVKLEESEFEYLKKRFDRIQDWLPAVIEIVADVQEILENAKEDPQITPE